MLVDDKGPQVVNAMDMVGMSVSVNNGIDAFDLRHKHL